MKTQIKHSTGKFYARTSHGEAELRYDMDDGVMRIYHTFVPEADRGMGLAKSLADAAFAFAKKNSMKIKPDCPYMVHYLEKNRAMQKLSV